MGAATALVALVGFVGFAAASFLASIIMAGAACVALRPWQLKLVSAIRAPLAAASLSALVFFLGSQWWADTSANLGLGLAGAGVAYAALLWASQRIGLEIRGPRGLQASVVVRPHSGQGAARPSAACR